MSPPGLFEAQTLTAVSPEEMDRLWADGWRHFGRDFFRYSLQPSERGGMEVILPLRLDVAAFRPSKSQRRVRRRNADADLRIVPATVDGVREALFLRHRERFTENIPESLRVFLPEAEPDRVPCPCFSVEVRCGGRLAAVSYFDAGATAISSVYALFDPGEAGRSLGILTMLAEIEWAAAQGKRWLYPGYATAGPGIYDYKKRFHPLQYFDWRGRWRPLPGGLTDPAAGEEPPPRA